ACGAGRVAVDQVVRLDRLPGDPTGTSVPSPGGTGVAGQGSAGSPGRGCTARPAWTAGARYRSPAGVSPSGGVAPSPARAGSSGDAPPLTRVCRTISVQDGFGRQAPVSLSPNTHRSFLNLLNFPKYRPTIQRFGLFGWLQHAHLQVSFHR